LSYPNTDLSSVICRYCTAVYRTISRILMMIQITGYQDIKLSVEQEEER